MTTIAIRDLPESFDLDRRAMLAIIGGSRYRGGPASPALRRGSRIIDYPPGLAGLAVSLADPRPAAGKRGK